MPNRTPDGTAYTVHGDKLDPCIVLIHGLGLTQATWQDHVSALVASHFVVTYDLYGHGDSVAPPQTASLALFAKQLDGLMSLLGIRSAHIVGFSLGGMINRRFALDFPQKVLSLGIFNSPHERSPELQKSVELSAANSDTGGPAAVIDAAIERWFTPSFIKKQPDYINRVKATVLANDADSYAQSRVVLANGVTELIKPTPPLEIATLIITCENDTGSTPAMSHAIASEIAGAETVIIPDLKHMGLVESPSLFTAALLLFLQKLSS